MKARLCNEGRKNMKDITIIIEIAVTVISAVLTGFLIPFVRSRLTAEKKERLEFWLSVAVKAAEQLFRNTEKAGAKKKDYVLGFLLSKGLVFDVDEVTALIESEVYKLKESTAKTGA